jgi:NAD(P)-dependent dehydrogenase (short-subunit alcohol dehydrogenase family)
MQPAQTALVTGASRGIGKEIALELARHGYRVALNYYNDPPSLVAATVAEIRALQPNRPDDLLAIEADIRSSTQVRAMFDRVEAAFGRLDLLVNNAGVQTWKPLLEVTEEEWDLVVDTNLKGCFLCTQQAARYMKDHGGGAIVNLGSGCNKLAFPSLVAYTASKGGIEMFTKEAAVELGRYNIRVNNWQAAFGLRSCLPTRLRVAQFGQNGRRKSSRPRPAETCRAHGPRFSSTPGFAPGAKENARSTAPSLRWPTPRSYPYDTKCMDWEFRISRSLPA